MNKVVLVDTELLKELEAVDIVENIEIMKFVEIAIKNQLVRRKELYEKYGLQVKC